MKSAILYIVFLLASFNLAYSQDDIDFENVFESQSIPSFSSNERVSSYDTNSYYRNEESTQSHVVIPWIGSENVDSSNINSNQSEQMNSDISFGSNETSSSTNASLVSSMKTSSTVSTSSKESSLALSNSSSTSTSTLKRLESITETFNNEALSDEGDNSSESSAMADGRTKSGRKSTIFFVSSSSEPYESTTSSDEEEEVVLGTRQNILPLPKTALQKAMEWMGDAYTLSIVMPIAAGVVFASTIIVFIATCRCIRRRCRRRRLRRKALPVS
ncbi:suppressor protein SRP40-like isoform X2 [Stegodyphus dumicola]|uniref:suppressor protein SRP40-like isoform X2 n=1 Tax=Stegodyphus dumicola TaxID=202533 RepID=UPI0015B0A6B3|nr:suppressor protein SRP40-like isoform X2 [Stegodyphus dumicola]